MIACRWYALYIKAGGQQEKLFPKKQKARKTGFLTRPLGSLQNASWAALPSCVLL
jgi:hypothetical protein